MLLGLFTGNTAWFLYALFLMFLLFPLILKAAELPGGKIAVAVLLLAAHFFPLWPKEFELADLARYLPCFALCYAVRCDLERMGSILERAEKRLGRVGLMALCLPIWGGFVALIVWLGEEREALIRLPALSAALIGILICIELVRWHIDSGFCKALAKIGSYSLQLYLFNGYFLTISRTVLVKLLGITSPFAIIPVNFAVILGLNYLFVHFVITKVKLFRTLTGMV